MIQVIDKNGNIYGEGFLQVIDKYGKQKTLSVGGSSWGSITGTLSSQTDLQSALDGKVDENAPITGATKTKVTYDAKGLVTSGADATTADISDSLNKRYVTDAQLTVIGNTSGTNTGDQDLSPYLTSVTAAATYQPIGTYATGGGTATGTNTGDETGTSIKTKLGSASISTDGYLLQTDWATFNGKQNALGFTPEDVSNKQTNLTASATKYPTVDAVNTGLSLKQDTLVSATNIKTINGVSILGSGDLTVSGSGLAQYQVRQIMRR